MNLIGVCGLIGSGKGTVADILVQNFEYEKISFADKLKDGVSAVFGWDRDMLEGDTDRSRLWRERTDEFWTKETGKEVSPRLIPIIKEIAEIENPSAGGVGDDALSSMLIFIASHF